MALDRAERREKLVSVFKEARECTRCALSDSRTQVVFGSGNADADLMFVGEAPGAEEDRQGLPFVGRSGAFLTRSLGEVGIDREDVFIANTLKCRPPENRDPLASEIETCQPWLFEQIDLSLARGGEVRFDETESAEGEAWVQKIEKENEGDLTPEKIARMEKEAAEKGESDRVLLDEEQSPTAGRRFTRT